MPSEKVGLILSNGEIIHLDNVSPIPENAFEVRPGDLITYEDRAVASWHTHPTTEAELSGEDYVGFLMWPDLLHLIISATEVRGYVVKNGAVHNDACKDHPAWSFAEDLASRVRV